MKKGSLWGEASFLVGKGWSMDEVKLVETLTDHKNKIGSLEHRMDKAECVLDEIRKLATSVQLLAEESKNTGEKVQKLTDKVDLLESAPGKKWTTVQTVAITAVVTALVSAAVGALINIL